MSGAMASGECSRRATDGRAWAGSRTAGSEGVSEDLTTQGFGGPVLVMSHSVFKIASGKFVSS